MKNLNSAPIKLILLTISFLLLTLISQQFFSSARLDLSEGGMYTLSDGAENIVSSIEEPVTLSLYFSDAVSRDLTGLRAYATQVKDLLREFELAAPGKIHLEIIDPEPFSEEEDQAAAYGLQGIPINGGDDLYFGLVGTNVQNDVEVIAFLQPDKEEFLEYDISKLLHALSVQEKPRVGILSSLPVHSELDMQTFQTMPAWVIIEQLEQLYVTQKIAIEADVLPEDIELLLLIHPKGMSDSMLYAIDQFVMNGGRLIAFLDPLAEQEQLGTNPMMATQPSAGSDLNALTRGWGVTLREDQVVLDAQAALSVAGLNGQAVRHLGIIGLDSSHFVSSDVTTASLETINLSSVGVFDIDPNSSTNITTILSSSDYASTTDAIRIQTLTDPQELLNEFSATSERYSFAVKISGPAQTAFPDRVNESADVVVSSAENINVMLVADTDLLSDRMWVQVQSFFGQSVVTPWANNGDFVINAVDNLVGSNDLIGIRSKGKFSRPFNVVLNLRRDAEASYLTSANDLQAQLEATEAKLTALENPTEPGAGLSVTPEQEAALVQFQDEKLRIRKELREVRHQLEKDIQALGSTLKFINIIMMPLLIVAFMLFLNLIRTSRRSADYS
ncbi:MAG: Gldg family protein [Pseudomonadales bacterium]|nr:Gldg family protein [Pseudomonadales bacterium]MDG1441159.1 Gldg family protein [Pseudomonadales bacterium]